MPTKKNKDGVISFKADETLLEAMANIPNRSEFIRSAILSALESVCPVCAGTGILSPNQKKHWEELSGSHKILECDECHEPVLVCRHTDQASKNHL